MTPPRHLLADPQPSELSDFPGTFVFRTTLPISLWWFPDDDPGSGMAIQIYSGSDLPSDELAAAAREVGEFFRQCFEEENEEAPDA